MPRKPETDPAVLEQRRVRESELTKVRVERFRQRKSRNQKLTEALAEITEADVRPSRSRNKQALLQTSLARYGVTTDRIIRKKAEALEATKFRKLGEEVREVSDYPTQLRTCELLTKDLQMAGELPSDAHPGTATHIEVKIMALTPEGKLE